MKSYNDKSKKIITPKLKTTILKLTIEFCLSGISIVVMFKVCYFLVDVHYKLSEYDNLKNKNAELYQELNEYKEAEIIKNRECHKWLYKIINK